MVYCTADDVREICEISSDDMDDTALEAVIATATVRLNQDINVIIKEETAEYIDVYRQNKIDGSNTVFYIRGSYNYLLGDYTNDGSVTIADAVIYLYDSSSETRTLATISSIDSSTGAITLDAAPATTTSKLTITYARAPLDESTPHSAVKEACKALAASLAYLRLRSEDYSKLALGDFAVTAYTGSSTNNRPFMLFLEYYQNLVDRINSGELIKKGDIPGLPYLLTNMSEEPWV